ncbi:MAG: hypothetical protein J6Z11_06840 [Candidatus Riflebacteria bacterium]|nr:hypothetical protein [Candidatus Riflebacteria bacterium]
MKYIYILLISIACLTLTGCGGGGGDDGVSLTPQQQEFADVVYAFATAVNDKDKDKAKKFIMADVVYNKTYGYDEFKNRLEGFIDKAENINFQVKDIGVSFLDTDQDSAEIRADVTIKYNADSEIKEILEIYVEKSGSLKGITLFQKYKSEVSAFPPIIE